MTDTKDTSDVTEDEDHDFPMWVNALIYIGAALFFWNLFSDDDTPSEPPVQVVSEQVTGNPVQVVSEKVVGNPLHKKLRFQALEQVKDYNTGLSGLCDTLANVSLKKITYGTANSGRGGTTRFPAIIANYDGICVASITGDRMRLDDFWVVLALDDLGNKIRCFQIAGKPVVDDIASSCAFKAD